MMSNDHKYSVPVNLFVRDNDDSNAIHGSLVATRWYRHLIAPRTPTGLWIRQIVEQSEDYLIHIMNQNKVITGESCNCCMILCGGGYDILLLQHDTPYPDHVDHIPMIALSLCLTSTLLPSKLDENYLDEYGIVDPIDDLHLHMRAEIEMGVFPGNFRIYLQVNYNCPAYQDQNVSKKVILRIENRTRNAATITKIDHKDAPRHIFAYQYDLWGIPLSIPQAEPKSTGSATKDQNILLPKKSAQQTSRKRPRTEISITADTKEKGITDQKVQNLLEPKPKAGKGLLNVPVVTKKSCVEIGRAHV